MLGLILAGGQSRRMGGIDKTALVVGERPLRSWVRDALLPQVTQLAVSGNAPDLTSLGLPLLPDPPGPAIGPLGGILAGLEWAMRSGGADAALLTVPGDTPFIPGQLGQNLAAARLEAGVEVALARSGGRTHHAIGLWSVALAGPLAEWLRTNERHGIRDFLRTRSTLAVDFAGAPDPFFNVNTPDDLGQARRLAQTLLEKDQSAPSR